MTDISLNIQLEIPQEAIAFATVVVAGYSLFKVTYEVFKARSTKEKIRGEENRKSVNKLFDVIGFIATPLELGYNSVGLFKAVKKSDGKVMLLAVACIFQQLTALLYKWAGEATIIQLTWRLREKRILRVLRKSMRYVVFFASAAHLYCRIYSGTYIRVASFIQLLGSGVIAAAVVTAITRTQEDELRAAQKRLCLTALQGVGLVGLLGTLVPVASGGGRVENSTQWFKNTAECTFILSVIEAAALDLISTYFEVQDNSTNL